MKGRVLGVSSVSLVVLTACAIIYSPVYAMPDHSIDTPPNTYLDCAFEYLDAFSPAQYPIAEAITLLCTYSDDGTFVKSRLSAEGIRSSDPQGKDLPGNVAALWAIYRQCMLPRLSEVVLRPLSGKYASSFEYLAKYLEVMNDLCSRHAQLPADYRVNKDSGQYLPNSYWESLRY